jgi:hypothetical protein
MFRLNAFVGAVLCLALASCATPADGPGFQPVSVASGKGTIYVYSLDYPYGTSKIDVDGHHVATMEHRGYVAIPVSAGKHTVRARKGCIPLCALGDSGRMRTIDVPRGGSVYLRVGVKYEGMAGTISLYSELFERVPNEIAEIEIRRTKKSSHSP